MSEIVHEQLMHVKSIWGQIDPSSYEMVIQIELHDGSQVAVKAKDLDISFLFDKLNQNKLKAKFVITVEP